MSGNDFAVMFFILVLFLLFVNREIIKETVMSWMLESKVNSKESKATDSDNSEDDSYDSKKNDEIVVNSDASDDDSVSNGSDSLDWDKFFSKVNNVKTHPSVETEQPYIKAVQVVTGDNAKHTLLQYAAGFAIKVNGVYKAINAKRIDQAKAEALSLLEGS